MADITNKDKIAAAKKALDEAKKLKEDAQAQLAKAEALYNKAKSTALSIQALATGGTTIDANAAAVASTAIGSDIGAAISTLSPEDRAKEIQKYKDEAKKLERKAQQELEKAQKALEGAKKRIIIIQEQLNVLFTKRTLKEKATTNKTLSKSKLKTANKKIKLNKAKLKAGLKKVIKTAGPIAIVFVFGRILNTYTTRLSNTVSQLSALVDKTNEIIQAATTKTDIQKAKVARDAALSTLSSAESQVEGFRKVIATMSKIINTITLLLNIVSAIPTSPYQIAPIAIKTTRTLAKFNPV
jgi:F0F1-type ATP synthase membrane subunit b/b'